MNEVNLLELNIICSLVFTTENLFDSINVLS